MPPTEETLEEIQRFLHRAEHQILTPDEALDNIKILLQVNRNANVEQKAKDLKDAIEQFVDALGDPKVPVPMHDFRAELRQNAKNVDPEEQAKQSAILVVRTLKAELAPEMYAKTMDMMKSC